MTRFYLCKICTAIRQPWIFFFTKGQKADNLNTLINARYFICSLLSLSASLWIQHKPTNLYFNRLLTTFILLSHKILLLLTYLLQYQIMNQEEIVASSSAQLEPSEWFPSSQPGTHRLSSAVSLPTGPKCTALSGKSLRSGRPLPTRKSWWFRNLATLTVRSTSTTNMWMWYSVAWGSRSNMARKLSSK